MPCAAEALSLREALAYAYTNNPQLLAERAQLRALDETVNQALGNWRPTAQLSTSQGYLNDDTTGGTLFQDQYNSYQIPRATYNLTVSQPLYRSGRTDAQVRKAMDTVRAEQAHLTSIEQQVLLKAATDYADVVQAEAAVELNIHNQQTLMQRLKSARAQLAGGAMTRVDVAQAEAAAQQAAATRYQAEIKAATARQSFLRDVGIQPGSVAYPSEPLALPASKQEALERAGVWNPDVLSADFSRAAAEDDIDVNFDQFLPKIDLIGTIQHQDNVYFKHEHDNFGSVTVKLSMAPYSGGVVESQTRAAKQTMEMRRQQVDGARASAAADAGSAWEKMMAQKPIMESYRLAALADVTALQGVEIQQKSGERTFLDVLNAEQTLLQVRQNYNDASHDKIVAEYTLASAMGLMTALSLRLPVRYYDPARHLDAVKDRWFGFGDENGN